MNIGAQVTHITYGDGKVSAADGEYIKVLFVIGSERIFQYPDAFEKFLSCADSGLNDEISSVIQQKHAEKLAKTEEAERARINAEKAEAERLRALSPVKRKRATAAKPKA